MIVKNSIHSKIVKHALVTSYEIQTSKVYSTGKNLFASEPNEREMSAFGNFQRSIWSLLCEVTDLSTFITVLQEAGLFPDREPQIIEVGITAEFMDEII